jgi:hypothetical protein
MSVHAFSSHTPATPGSLWDLSFAHSILPYFLLCSGHEVGVSQWHCHHQIWSVISSPASLHAALLRRDTRGRSCPSVLSPCPGPLLPIEPLILDVAENRFHLCWGGVLGNFDCMCWNLRKMLICFCSGLWLHLNHLKKIHFQLLENFQTKEETSRVRWPTPLILGLQDWSSRPGWAKSLQDPVSTNKKLGMVVEKA